MCWEAVVQLGEMQPQDHSGPRGYSKVKEGRIPSAGAKHEKGQENEVGCHAEAWLYEHGLESHLLCLDEVSSGSPEIGNIPPSALGTDRDHGVQRDETIRAGTLGYAARGV